MAEWGRLTRAEETTPSMRAICCLYGVEPRICPAFKSCPTSTTAQTANHRKRKKNGATATGARATGLEGLAVAVARSGLRYGSGPWYLQVVTSNGEYLL